MTVRPRPLALVTGSHGTLAPRVAAAARWRGFDVIGWDRSLLPTDGTDAEQRGREWLVQQRPDAILHLATGSAGWAARLAADAAARGVPMVFTSTAMVFDHDPDGPHQTSDHRSARDDYGRSKIACEDAITAANPQACIARLGWQIDATLAGNNMLVQLDQQQARNGHIAASRAWRPATSFVDDSAAALLDLVQRPLPGVVHLDSNADEGHAFDAIVYALRERFGRGGWAVRVNDVYRHDQRLAGGAARLPPLSARLPGLGRR